MEDMIIHVPKMYAVGYFESINLRQLIRCMHKRIELRISKKEIDRSLGLIYSHIDWMINNWDKIKFHSNITQEIKESLQNKLQMAHSAMSDFRISQDSGIFLKPSCKDTLLYHCTEELAGLINQSF